MVMKVFLETAHLLADLAGEVAHSEWYGNGKTTFKADQSALTDAYLMIEKKLRQVILERHPEHSVLGEEFGRLDKASEYTWIIDPID